MSTTTPGAMVPTLPRSPSIQEISDMLWKQGACCDCGGRIWTRDDATAHATGDGCGEEEGEGTFIVVHPEFFQIRAQRNESRGDQ